MARSEIAGFAECIGEQISMHPSLMAAETSANFLIGHAQAKLADLILLLDREPSPDVIRYHAGAIAAAAFALQNKLSGES